MAVTEYRNPGRSEPGGTLSVGVEEVRSKVCPEEQSVEGVGELLDT